MIFPTFIGIGPGRTASTMLYELFREHPGICTAAGTKETNYFSRNYGKGLKWYASFFAGAGDYQEAGEISINYIYHDETPARIYSLLPKVKLLTCLRNPFDRLRSVYIYRKRAGTMPSGTKLEQAVDTFPDLVMNNRYHHHISRFLSLFPREQMLIQLYDDLLASPPDFAGEVLRFIGVDDSFHSEIVFRRINSAAIPRSRVIGSLAMTVAGTLRRFNRLKLMTTLKRSDLVRWVVLKQVSPRQLGGELRLSDQTVRRLQEIWEPELKGVEELTGRSLAHWRLPSEYFSGG